jgi:hypothetical protein
MKTIIAISFLIASAIFSQISFASENVKVGMLPMDDGKALLEVSHNSIQNFGISILNPMGETIYSHETKGESANFKQKYDFSRLEEGIYKVRVKIEGGSTEQMMTINKNGIQMGESIIKTDPFFSYKNDMLTLSYLNHNSNPMSVHLYEQGNLVWEQKLVDSFAVSKGFNLAKLNKGDYQVVFASGDEVYEYQLTRE